MTSYDRFWAEFLGIAPSAWASAGVSVRAHVGLLGYRGLWCFRHDARTVVSVPAAWKAVLRAKIAGSEPGELFEEAFLVQVLGDDFERLIGPTFQGCLERDRFRPAPSAHVRFVTPADTTEVERFRSECPADDWASSALDKATDHVAAYFDGMRILAMAGYRSWDRFTGDPCVLTHPDHRGRGYATAAVSAVVRAALAEDKLLLYQTLESNRGAVEIARKLGYAQYGTHVAVRLRRESPADS